MVFVRSRYLVHQHRQLDSRLVICVLCVLPWEITNPMSTRLIQYFGCLLYAGLTHLLADLEGHVGPIFVTRLRPPSHHVVPVAH